MYLSTWPSTHNPIPGLNELMNVLISSTFQQTRWNPGNKCPTLYFTEKAKKYNHSATNYFPHFLLVWQILLKYYNEPKHHAIIMIPTRSNSLSISDIFIFNHFFIIHWLGCVKRFYRSIKNFWNLVCILSQLVQSQMTIIMIHHSSYPNPRTFIPNNA